MVVFTELLTVKVSKKQMEGLDAKASELNMKKAEVVRQAITSFVNENSVLHVPLTENEWEYLRTVAKDREVSLDTAVRMIMEELFLLAYVPVLRAIKPKEELREEVQKIMTEKKNNAAVSL